MEQQPRELNFSISRKARSEEMSGIKRDHEGTHIKKEREMNSNAKPSLFMPMFETFRDELDEHHDRRERIIKASRDITAASKKIIFSLQRVRTLGSPFPPKILSETREKFAIIGKNFASIASDLAGINSWRYQRQISGGVQEFMEAVSFEHYLLTQSLITFQGAASRLTEFNLELTSDDYILGLFDLVGELMRFAITTMATTGSLPASDVTDEDGKRDVLIDLRSLRSCFEALDATSAAGTGLGKDVEKKMEVMQMCVEKVESAVYGLIIRGRERPKGWIPNLDGGSGEVESY